MLSWFRTRGRLLAAAVLVSLVTLGTLSAVPHVDDCHGEPCVFSIAAHDPSQHAIQNAGPGEDHTLHCVVCHWTRLHRPSVDVTRQFAPYIERHDRVPVETIAVSPVFPAAQPPLRSPPDVPSRFV